ncbi:hypothetical protein NPIL_375731 [Nephila pilipes]|uniref:Uncharacterized protein n=1 Tax=Nephila pilipes TaxID=299642 RepID=A0A8X6MVW5_NEPPI|nr:hypothetical protein NPIL_375731 [Nephila pilipes]
MASYVNCHITQREMVRRFLSQTTFKMVGPGKREEGSERVRTFRGPRQNKKIVTRFHCQWFLSSVKSSYGNELFAPGILNGRIRCLLREPMRYFATLDWKCAWIRGKKRKIVACFV